MKWAYSFLCTTISETLQICGLAKLFSISRKSSSSIRPKVHTQVHSQAISQNRLKLLERNKV
jgi:hypothetical protein